MYRSSSGHLVHSFRVARRGRGEVGGGGFFRNFRVVMCRCNTGTPSLYFWFSWILLLYTKLNFPNSSLSKSFSLISIPSPRLSCLNTIPYKAAHYISHLAVPPPPRGGVGCPLNSFITNFNESTEKIYIHIHTCSCKKKIHFSFLLDKLKPASYFIFQTFWRFYVGCSHLLANKEDNCLHIS